MATFYIDFDSGSDSNTSAQAQNRDTPWKRMKGMAGVAGNAASYSVQSGDIFVFKGGVTWTMTSTTDDMLTLPSSNITLQGGQQLVTPWGTGYPVLNASGSTGTRAIIYSNAKSDITIDGIKLYGSYWSAGDGADGGGAGIQAYYDTNNWEIKNSYFDLIGVNGIAHAVGSTDVCNNFKVHDNKFFNLGRLHFAYDDGAEVTNIEIYNNEFNGMGTWYSVNWGNGNIVAAGINYEVGDIITVVQTGASGATLRVTEVDGGGGVTRIITTDRGTGYFETSSPCATTSPSGGTGFTTTIGSYHADGIMIGQSSTTRPPGLNGVKIHHNKFNGDWSTGATALIYLNDNALPVNAGYGGTNCEIYDNQICIDSNGIISPAMLDINSGWDNVFVYNNTFDSYNPGSSNTSACIGIYYDIDNVTIKNNIFSNATNAVVINGDPLDHPASNIVLDYNLYYNNYRMIMGWPGYPSSDARTLAECQGGVFNQEAHGKVGDPKFTQNPTGIANSGIWTIQADSPAATGGTNLGIPYNLDLNGVSGTRIGAYEYGSGGGGEPSGVYSTVKVGTGAVLKLGTGAGFKIE